MMHAVRMVFLLAAFQGAVMAAENLADPAVERLVHPPVK